MSWTLAVSPWYRLCFFFFLQLLLTPEAFHASFGIDQVNVVTRAVLLKTVRVIPRPVNAYVQKSGRTRRRVTFARLRNVLLRMIGYVTFPPTGPRWPCFWMKLSLRFNHALVFKLSPAIMCTARVPLMIWLLRNTVRWSSVLLYGSHHDAVRNRPPRCCRVCHHRRYCPQTSGHRLRCGYRQRWHTKFLVFDRDVTDHVSVTAIKLEHIVVGPASTVARIGYVGRNSRSRFKHGQPAGRAASIRRIRVAACVGSGSNAEIYRITHAEFFQRGQGGIQREVVICPTAGRINRFDARKNADCTLRPTWLLKANSGSSVARWDWKRSRKHCLR